MWKPLVKINWTNPNDINDISWPDGEIYDLEINVRCSACGAIVQRVWIFFPVPVVYICENCAKHHDQAQAIRVALRVKNELNQ